VHTIFWLIESCCHARTRLTAFGMEKEGDVRTGTACHTVTLCPHATEGWMAARELKAREETCL
jgi:hypothetical protein